MQTLSMRFPSKLAGAPRTQQSCVEFHPFHRAILFGGVAIRRSPSGFRLDNVSQDSRRATAQRASPDCKPSSKRNTATLRDINTRVSLMIASISAGVRVVNQ